MDKSILSVNTVLKLGLLFSPIAYKFNVGFQVFDLFAFYTFVMALIAAACFSAPVRKCDLSVFGCAVLVLIASLFVHQYQPLFVTCVLNVLLGIVAIGIISNYCTRQQFVDYMIIAGALNIIYLSCQMLGFSPIVKNPLGQPGGLMGNAPRLGMYLCLILPYVYARSKTAFFLFMSTGPLLNEILTLICGTVVLLYHCAKRKYLIVIYLSIIAGAVFYGDYIVERVVYRLQIWGPVLEHIFTRPVEGHGIGSFPALAPQVLPGTVWQAETAFSSLLQFPFEFGVFFAVGWLAYFIFKYKGEFAHPHALGLLMIGILCVSEYPLQVERLWIPVCVIIGLFLADVHGMYGPPSQESVTVKTETSKGVNQ